MSEKQPTLAEWQRLYEAAVRIKKLAPWQWMTETDIFGVRSADSDNLLFVSVMGMLGEHFAVTVYLGDEALYKLWELVEAEDTPATAFRLMEIPQLQVSFEDRDLLAGEDRKVIKDLGLKFRGRNAWPWFRSFRPGWAPWFLEGDEIRLLTVALEQLEDVAPRFARNPGLLETPNPETYFVRAARPAGSAVAWDDLWKDVPPPATLLVAPVDPKVIEALKQLPRMEAVLEVDAFPVPAKIKESRDARPFFPYTLMLVDRDSGQIVAGEMLTPIPSWDAMWAGLPGRFARILDSFKALPAGIVVQSTQLAEMLDPLAQALDIHLDMDDELPALEPAREGLRHFMERGR